MPVESYHGFVDSLLRDPSEIWHHAYEQEISEAGRSVLLAIRTLGGKCDVPVLEGVFGPLHMHRAARYNFSRRPEDFRVGIREVMNSFIKPCGQDGFEVIDTSVLDLLNAVARGAPDNAVDMIEGAARFDQIEQIWSLAKAERGGNILAALKRESHRIAPSIARLARLRRRFDIEGGGVGYFSPTFEVRLALIVEMAQRLGAPLIAALIAPAYVLLLEEWGAERPQINDAIKLLRTMDAAVSLPADSITPMRNTVLDAVLEEARTGCRADELREILDVVDTRDTGRELAIVRESFANYQLQYFSDDLFECRSHEQYDGLIEDLELFRDELGVDVDALIQRVEEANAEFEEREDQYGDYMQDEWKERSPMDWDDDRRVAEMFGSLKGAGERDEHPEPAALDASLIEELQTSEAGEGSEAAVESVAGAISVPSPRRSSRCLPLARLALKPLDRRKVDRYLDVTKAALLFGGRAILVEGIAEALLLPAIAKHHILKGHKDKLRIFQSVVFITIDGVDFVPFVSLLLTEVNGTRIADRVVVMTDGDKGTRAEDDEEDTANDGEAETRNTLPDETEQSGDGTRAAPEEEVVDGGLIPGERRKFALDRLAGELGATDYFAEVISTYSLESELIEVNGAGFDGG
ncbi:hypothetical protein V6Z69_20830 [Cereibacter sphaeroides]|uniref:hypothetical protein n=1 Tax=Cereibacter sphaeroides TaxID=1063 RepID=UPI00399058B0